MWYGNETGALSLTDDPLMAKSPGHVASPNDESSDYPPRGDALVAPNERGGAKKGTEAYSSPLPANQPANVATPNRINPRPGHLNRCLGCGSEFHLRPQRPGPTPKAAWHVSIAMDPPGSGDRDTIAGGGFCYVGSSRMALRVTQ